jgi:hypothetical protein
VPYALAASTAVGFATVADLLVIGGLTAIHLTPPLDIVSDSAYKKRYLASVGRAEQISKKASDQPETETLYQSVST